MTNAPQVVECAGQAGAEVDGSFQADRISGEMAAVGGLVLRDFTNDLGANQAVFVARQVFSAMRKVEVRQLGKEVKLCAEDAKTLEQKC
jgi:hypothetical protein